MWWDREDLFAFHSGFFACLLACIRLEDMYECRLV